MVELSSREVSAKDGCLCVADEMVKVFAEKDPDSILWGHSGADIVCDSTGVFKGKDKAGLHLGGGEKVVERPTRNVRQGSSWKSRRLAGNKRTPFPAREHRTSPQDTSAETEGGRANVFC